MIYFGIQIILSQKKDAKTLYSEVMCIKCQIGDKAPLRNCENLVE
jgi:hypothetical protein